MESHLIAAQNKAIRTNNVQTRMDKTKQNENTGYMIIEMKRSKT